MARRIKDEKLDTRSARQRLKQRREPYWCSLSGGLALGYRKGRTGGHWIARHYAADSGRRYRALGPADDTREEGVLSFDEAQRRAREWLGRAGSEEAPRGRYTVGHACDDYLAFLQSEGRTAAAVRDAAYRIDAFIRPLLGRLEVAALKAERLRRWRADLASAGSRLRTRQGDEQRFRPSADERARKATANRILTTLKAALNHAFDEEKVGSNNAWGRRVAPFKDVERARIRFLQVDEVRRLVNACEPAFRLIVQAALQTGARYSEIARFKVADFDADSRSIFVDRSKGGKARHVRLSDEGFAFFKQACRGRPRGELIFHKDGAPWLKSHQARPMAAACKAARISPPIGFHGLRHTYASLLVKNRAPLHVVALNLGHVTKDGQPDVRMVTRHYAHLEPSDVATMIRDLAPKFGFKPDPTVKDLKSGAR
jgi:integrase